MKVSRHWLANIRPLWLLKKGMIITLQKILQVRASLLGSQQWTAGLFHMRKCLFVLVCDSPLDLWEKEPPQQWCEHNPESWNLGLIPGRGVNLLLGESEESKWEMKSFFFAYLPVNYSPSFSYPLLSIYWVTKKSIFSLSFPLFLDSVIPPGRVVGRAIWFFLFLGFTAIDKIIHMLAQRSVGRKTRRLPFLL